LFRAIRIDTERWRGQNQEFNTENSSRHQTAAMNKARRFREVWPIRFLAILIVFAFVVGWLAWYVHSVIVVLFWLAIIAWLGVLIIRDWWRLPW